MQIFLDTDGLKGIDLVFITMFGRFVPIYFWAKR